MEALELLEKHRAVLADYEYLCAKTHDAIANTLIFWSGDDKIPGRSAKFRF